MRNKRVNIIGGGLAGCEAAFQLLKRGFEVTLYEMRGVKQTPCHKGTNLAELVCSNSLKSMNDDTASGLLKKELKYLGCMLLDKAYLSSVEAGSALAINRTQFSALVEEELNKFDGFSLVREEVVKIDKDIPTIIATGPLTSDSLAEEIKKIILNDDDLHFYDAIAPIIDGSTIDMSEVFWGSRYDKGEKESYLNIPFTKEQYDAFYNELVNAEVVILKDFEKGEIFEGCMPIEVMAKRGYDALRYGPLRPVGLRGDNGEKYYAVLQLRKEDQQGQMFNMVGFQTNLLFKEQKRIFRGLSGLKNAEFYRYGVMHRNTYLNSPLFLDDNFQVKEYPNIFFAGQITGVEGYVESIASGLLAGLNMARYLSGEEKFVAPRNTICGALSRHVSTSLGKNFEPMNASFGILEAVELKTKDKKARKMEYTRRAMEELKKTDLVL